MAYVIISPFGQRLFDALQPWQTDDLARYCQAIGTMFDPVAGLVTEQGSDGDPAYVPTWGALFDVDQCPTNQLGYLGQYVGVPVPVGTPDVTARSLIRSEAGQARGTPAAVRAAIERSISTPWEPDTTYAAGVLVTYGTPPTYYLVTTAFTSGATFTTTSLQAIDPASQYELLERINQTGAPDAYWLTIIVRPEQLTPPNSATALLAAVGAVKPAGVLLNVVVSDATPWTGLAGAWTAQTPSWQQL